MEVLYLVVSIPAGLAPAGVDLTPLEHGPWAVLSIQQVMLMPKRDHHIKPDKPEYLSPYLLDVGVFSIAEIKLEISSVLSALPQTNAEFPEYWESEEYLDLVFKLTSFAGINPPNKKALSTHLQLFTDEEIAVLRKYLTQILRALKESETYAGQDFDPPETCLLPTAWARRMDYLLAQRIVPIAWIQRIDATKF